MPKTARRLPMRPAPQSEVQTRPAQPPSSQTTSARLQHPMPPAAPVSIAAVAKDAGVSVATVSRVLNRQNVVTPGTRERVLASVSRLGYRINELGRNLRTAESRLLLAMVPDIGNPFYAEIVRGIDGVARDHGYFVLLCDTGADENRERSYFDLLRSHRADGAICLDPDTVQHALAQQAAMLPWVACCEFDPAAGVPYVGIDNRAAARDAVRHLLARGRRRIALINSDDTYLYARLRRQGWRDALRGAGLPADPAWAINVQGLDFADGARAARELMRRPDPPDAIFAVSDTLAIGAMAGLREAGAEVPGDVAVVGFDDIALAAVSAPPLTTVAQPMRALGASATQLLLQRLADPLRPVPGMLLEHRLVIRGSS